MLSHAIFTFTPLVESRAEAIYELISQKATSGPPEHMFVPFLKKSLLNTLWFSYSTFSYQLTLHYLINEQDEISKQGGNFLNYEK